LGDSANLGFASCTKSVDRGDDQAIFRCCQPVNCLVIAESGVSEHEDGPFELFQGFAFDDEGCGNAYDPVNSPREQSAIFYESAHLTHGFAEHFSQVRYGQPFVLRCFGHPIRVPRSTPRSNPPKYFLYVSANNISNIS
jgi:hypothetical protein